MKINHTDILTDLDVACCKPDPVCVHRTAVINIVGLTPSLVGEHTPFIKQFIQAGKQAAITPSIPAVTCTVQTSYLTGQHPDQHGIVSNGWYFKDECEVKFWKQSNKLIQKPKIWDLARSIDPTFTCANSFWWYNMYSSVDYSVTPRPMYPADGRKLPDIHTQPATLRDDLQEKFGQFPLFHFWGPMSSILSTQWIVSSSIEVDKRYKPTLHLVYLPHLDYCLQKFGPNAPGIAPELKLLDDEVKRLVEYFVNLSVRVILLSEYGIVPVNKPIHLNRVLREKGYLSIRKELGRELLDCGASKAFAMADHQVAHVYVNDPSSINAVRDIIASTPGVGQVYTGTERAAIHLNHDRAGDIIALATPDAWFTYYYWQDDQKSPDFARCVDIHRKPGYDPCELILDPTLSFAKARIARILLMKKLGFRNLLDVIGLDASIVKGSHGLAPVTRDSGPLLVSNVSGLICKEMYHATDIHSLILEHLTKPV